MTTPEGTHTEARDWLEATVKRETADLGSPASRRNALTTIMGAADTYAARAAAHARDGERERCARLAEQHNALYLAVGDSQELSGMEPFAALLRQDQP